MSMLVQKSQVHKTTIMSQDDDKRLCLVDDLKEAQVHIQVKLYGTSSSLKSMITTTYHKMNGKPDISFLHVFGALCYPKNDREDIGKLGAKGDIGFFIGYSANSRAYRVYNRRTKKIMETMNVTFDVSAMAFEQSSSKTRLQSMTSQQISSGLDLTYASSTITTQKPTEHELDLLFEAIAHNIVYRDSNGVKTTFLHDVKKERRVRCCQTEGFIDADHPSRVYKLKKALYGLHIEWKLVIPVGTLVEIKDKLDLDKNGTLVDATKYQSMIGVLMYLTSSRLDIVHATCLCARYQAQPTEKNLKEVGEPLIWITNYGFHFNMIPIYCDLKSAIAISCNPVQHLRTKHIVVRYHFIKEHVEKGTIELYFVKTDYQLADLFTKALPVDRFNYLVRRLGMRSLSPHELERLAKSQ
ncbi:retrovirus-related pol polyprotein from transposon TNT 1-94 [Tanacetum coccineum]